jgi:uncharacterized protein YciI
MRPGILAFALLLCAPLTAVAAQAPAAGQPAGQIPFLALYRRGPAYDESRPLFEQPSIPAHIAHHEALGERLLGAGPLRGTPDGVVGAILILARDAAQADAWLAADPAVRAGTFTATIAAWSTSAIRSYRRQQPAR